MSTEMNMNRPETRRNGQRVARRDFVKLGGAVAAGVASAGLFDPRFAHAATSQTSAETVVAELYASLSDKQKKAIWRPFDHQARRRINPNWHVTDVVIGDDLFSKKQRTLIDQIVRNITSKDGYDRLIQQMDEDDGGMENYSVAIFGEPGTDQFQFEMTGRHLTMRADGNRVDKAAFGGPIVYGHGEENPSDNLFFYQTQKTNEVFQALDADQAEAALLKKAPRETAVQLQGAGGQFPGLAVSKLASDQKELVESTLKVLLAPYREEDVDEVMAILKSSGGLDQLHMAFYQEEDLDDDKVWDIWRVEGPSLVWHFRGAPHVHAYINIGVKS
ncbi:hypothetical protein CKO51_27675 [Rhodopirellula sp. SM50]|nr:DUF3500 domain-containing protein [Rhodopirellula sp. SM50]PAY16240.1 hypothetical protein CKO51_27675 [Rhodopirellula sp. SM50]